MTTSNQGFIKRINNFCILYHVAVSFSGDDVTIALPDGREAIIDSENFEHRFYETDSLRGITFQKSGSGGNGMSLDQMFTLAKQYDLDITITSEGDLNVFDGSTELQSTMTVDELNEYVTYLGLKNKFSSIMK